MYENVPQKLREQTQWVNWRAEERQGKLTKVPMYWDGAWRHASSTNAATWRDFDAVVEAQVVHPGADGIGFVFTVDDPFVGLDLDGMYGPDGWTDTAEHIFAVFGPHTYVEISPSGTGGHLITVGEVGRGRKADLADGTKIEVYDRGRFFTLTGEGWGPVDGAFVENQDALQWLFDTYLGQPLRAEDRRPDGHIAAIDAIISDAAVPPFEKFEAISRALHPKWTDTWNKTAKMPKDQSMSAYELSLADMMAKAGWTPQEMVDTLVAFRRKHGGEAKHAFYYQETLRVAAEFAARTHALEALPHADMASVKDSQSIVTHLTGLDIVRYVQTGKAPATYRVYFSDGDSVVLGLAEKARAQATWQTVAQERLKVPFEALTKTQWQQFLVCLGKIVEREDVEEAGFINEFRDHLHLYSKHGDTDCYDTIKDSKPFVTADGVLHLNIGHFAGWLRTMQRLHKAENEILSTLKLLNATREEVHRRAERRRDVKKRYWALPLDMSQAKDV